MSILTYTHWVKPVSGFQLHLDYNPKKGYFITSYPAHRDSPESPYFSLNIMFRGEETLLACSRKSAKKEQEAIALFQQKIKEFISAHPPVQESIETISPGDRFLLGTGTVTVIWKNEGGRYFCLTQDGKGKNCTYSGLLDGDRLEPLPPAELESLTNDFLDRQSREKAEKEEREKESKRLIEIGRAMVPEWAKGVLVAEFTEDHSDMMTDYYCPCVVVETRVLGFSRSSRLSEAELRRFAPLLEQTAHLQDGSYVRDDRALRVNDYARSGWQVRHLSYWGNEIFRALGVHGLPVQQEKPVPVATDGEISIRRNEEKDGLEVIFASKPEPEILAALKLLGFRWSKFSKLWYAKYSESLEKELKETLGLA